MQPPKKPTLNHLNGCIVISPQLREALEINEGVLNGEVKYWSDTKFLVNTYFKHVDSYELRGNIVFKTFLNTLEDLSKIKFADEEGKKKTGSDRLALINDVTVMVPQANLFLDYCKKMKTYLSSPTIKSKFIAQYAKIRKQKQKKAEKRKRQEEEKEEKNKMLHEGKMVAYLAVEMGLSQIRNEVQAQISQEKQKQEQYH